MLLGPPLPRAPDVAHPWDIAYLLEWLRPHLPGDSRDFLAALLDAINDPAQAAALDRFPPWRDTPALPLDTPWPDAAQASPSPEPIQA